MFMGTTYNSIDEKNRMIVPSKLRAGLGSRCVLTKGLDRCLYIYTMEDWEKQMQKIAQKRRVHAFGCFKKTRVGGSGRETP